MATIVFIETPKGLLKPVFVRKTEEDKLKNNDLAMCSYEKDAEFTALDFDDENNLWRVLTETNIIRFIPDECLTKHPKQIKYEEEMEKKKKRIKDKEEKRIIELEKATKKSLKSSKKVVKKKIKNVKNNS